MLVVDDRCEARRLVADELGGVGFEVLEAADGEAGWATFRWAWPDLVVSDLRMPGADGIELLRRIRAVSSVPVFLLSAWADVPVAVTAMKAGAAEVLSFPDDLPRLMACALALPRRDDAEPDPMEGPAPEGAPLDRARSRRREAQRRELLAAVDASGGNLAEAARRLGLSRSTVVYRVRALGLAEERAVRARSRHGASVRRLRGAR